MKPSRFKGILNISDDELQLLELVNKVGPCTSEEVHVMVDSGIELLLVMRRLHILVEKGFLQRITINSKLMYRTARNYGSVRNQLLGRER